MKSSLSFSWGFGLSFVKNELRNIIPLERLSKNFSGKKGDSFLFILNLPKKKSLYPTFTYSEKKLFFAHPEKVIMI